MAAQRLAGLRPEILTSPYHQLDDPAASDTTICEVPCRRTPLSGRLARRLIEERTPILAEIFAVRLLRQRILSLLDQARFDLVHAHSPALWGLAASQAARSRGLPLVYEIRAFWEDAAVDQNKSRPGGVRYRLSRNLESYVVDRADAVVGIARHMLDDLRRRGVSEQKLFHIPNGVEAARFAPRPRDDELAARLGLDGAPVFGFVGSLYRYEGIAWLVRALAEFRRRSVAAKLLVVGDGKDLEEIRRAVRETASESQVILAGRVPHNEVPRYYSVMDVLAYPRLAVRLTELTTPLKPLEAMAQARPVLASAVGGNEELIEQGRTGLLFQPENVEEFCRQAERLLASEELRRALGERARQEVLREKDWGVLAERYERVYESAMSRGRNGR